MFPSRQNNQLSFQISSNPYQDNTIPQDLILILGNSSIDQPNNNKIGIAKGRQPNPCLIKDDDDNHSKKIMHRDIERRRRQEMTSLYTSLRNLLPLEYIKGKRAISDHVHQAVKYINDLQKRIKELSIHRDDMKNVCNLRVVSPECDDKLNSPPPTSVVVRSCFGGIEVVINRGFGNKKVLQLSRVLELLHEQGLDVVNCVSTKVHQRIIHSIQSEVSYTTSTCIDISELQNKLIEAIPSSTAENDK